MLDLRNVSKRYGRTLALAATSIALAPGRTTVVIGPSGCGKSTLLRLAAGLISCDTGTIEIAGETLTTKNVLRLRQQIGYVIQEGGLFPHLTARANVALMARYLGRDRGDIDARVDELAGLVHLSPDMLQRFPAELSGGQRQRVSLMRALMLNPAVLLLDEPLGALDPMIRYDLQRELKAIFRQLGKTVLMVTHDIVEAGFFGDTIVLMRDGRVVQRGTLKELIETPAEPFVEQFIRAQRGPLEALGAGS